MTKLNVAVFGAGGYLGEHIVQALLKAGHSVVAAVRQMPEAVQSQISYQVGNLQDLDYIRQVIDQADAAIFSAGCIWQPEIPIAEYQERNTQITANFFAALGERPQMPVVYTSSMSAVAGSAKPFCFDEQSGRAAVSEKQLSPYDLAKIAAEQIAIASAQQGNRVVILNPGNMLGPGVTHQSKITTTILVQWFCQGNLPFYINGGHSYCDVRDVAQAHVAALSQGQAGQRYIVAGHNLTMAQICQEMVKLTGLPMPKALPLAVISIVAKIWQLVCQSLNPISGGKLQNPYHPDFVKSFGLHYFGDSSAAIAELGYQITPIATTLLDTIRDFYQRGLLGQDWRFLEALTPAHPDQATQVICLQQLVQSHIYAQTLLPKLPEIYRTCADNPSLRQALSQLAEERQFNPQTGAWVWPPQTKPAQKVVHKLLDYVYFASDNFLAEVL